MRLSALLVTAALAVSGCIAPDDAAADQRLTGWFNDWNDDIEADFEATIKPYGVDALYMESFPPGFSVSPLAAEDCSELREILLAKDYIASVGDCESAAETNYGGWD